MLKQTMIPVLVLIAVLTPGLAASQETPAGKWWKNPRVIERLQLSDDEIDRLDSAFLKSRRKLIKLKGAVETEQLELDDLLERRRLNEDSLLEQYRAMEGARTELAMEQFKFILEIRKILGYERFQTIKLFRENIRQRRQEMLRERQSGAGGNKRRGYWE